MNIFTRSISLLLICSILFGISVPIGATEDVYPSVSAKSAVLLEAHDGDILYAKDEHIRMGMASTTKIMTALVAIEALPCDKLISIPSEAVNIEGSSVYLCQGELLSVEQLLYALLLASANDAAVALAIAVSGRVEDFAKRMNERAAELDLKNTSFTNPHGLYDDEHYTTAYDLAVIAKEALKNDVIRRIVQTKKAQIPHGVTVQNKTGDGVRYLQNHNKMLSIYDGAIGVKTGFTKKTGRCLVSAAERDGLCLIAVTLSASDDWNDHKKMLDYGFSVYERVTLFRAGEFSFPYEVCAGRETHVILTNKEAITLSLPRQRQEMRIEVSSHQHFEFAPINKGDILAELCVSIGAKSAKSRLIASYSVQKTTKK